LGLGEQMWEKTGSLLVRIKGDKAARRHDIFAIFYKKRADELKNI
jgi:hypothetical protein